MVISGPMARNRKMALSLNPFDEVTVGKVLGQIKCLKAQSQKENTTPKVLSWKNSEFRSTKLSPVKWSLDTARFTLHSCCPSWSSWTWPEPGPNGESEQSRKLERRAMLWQFTPCCGSLHVTLYVTVEKILK